ncbi:hypothetical protein GCM10007898_07780 [Dyella flagellata]|uniref:Uncharacterized protein n=1 Tax=Dyella flagellata TaxID=1867833 RepID=A0ABQ5X7S6_9GAMM|nr:hypothetical protein GCM10007898_07780 [Dyella flagellata]
MGGGASAQPTEAIGAWLAWPSLVITISFYEASLDRKRCRLNCSIPIATVKESQIPNGAAITGMSR